MSGAQAKRPARIPIGARPQANPQAEAWIRQRDGSDAHKGDLYTARLTLDITPALRARIKVAAFTQNTTVRARLILAVLSACGVAALAWASFVQPAVHVVYNPFDSVPVGWYRIMPASASPLAVHMGSIVLVRLSANAAALAAQRGYLPARIALLKRVGTVAPQPVCIENRELRINGVPVAALLPADRVGRPLQPWPHCQALADGELFLLSETNPASFDSRYFGPIQASAVIGIAQPIHLELRR